MQDRFGSCRVAGGFVVPGVATLAECDSPALDLPASSPAIVGGRVASKSNLARASCRCDTANVRASELGIDGGATRARAAVSYPGAFLVSATLMAAGRVAQRESACFTRKRSQVQNLPRPHWFSIVEPQPILPATRYDVRRCVS